MGLPEQLPCQGGMDGAVERFWYLVNPASSINLVGLAESCLREVIAELDSPYGVSSQQESDQHA
jgi:hypothetical protein